MRGPAIPRDERDQIIALAQAGLGDAEIAERTGRSRKTVIRVRVRAGVHRKPPLTDEQCAQILTWARAGLPDTVIARKVNRSVKTIADMRRQAKIYAAPVPLSDDLKQRIVALRGTGRSQMSVVREFGVSQGMVWRLWNRDEDDEAPLPAPSLPDIEDRWREALAGRVFRDAIAFDAGKGKVGRVVVETGIGRSSMAYA